MKSIYLILIGILIASVNLPAQNSLSNLFNKLTSGDNNTINSLINTATDIIGNNKVTDDDIPGRWCYQGSAIAFESENALNNAGGSIIGDQVSKKLDTYLAKIGLKENTFVMTFSADKSVSLQFAGKAYSGTWEYDQEKAEIRLNFAKLFKVNCLVDIKGTSMNLLFKADALLKVLKSISSKSSNATLKLISSTLNPYTGMRVGFELKK